MFSAVLNSCVRREFVARRGSHSVAELRSRYLSFFEKQGHKVLPSSSVVPNDPSLLFTAAGMVQFKDVLLQKAAPVAPSVTTVQKCMRAGGKHNDLDNVGLTRRHHTFFEMAGNFSFGGYFREEAIALAWKFLLEDLQLPQHKLRFTVLEGDDKSEAVWRKLGATLVDKCGKEDNFWSMGPTGPCGPCTEIYYDMGEGDGSQERWLELWNVVLMENDQGADGIMRPLPVKCIDTGMGVERTAAVLQGKTHNFAIDSLKPIVEQAHHILSPNTSSFEMSPLAISARIFADHTRAACFLIAAGVYPSNVGRGYVLRRMIRRAARHARQHQVDKPCLALLVPTVVQSMGAAYPELVENQVAIERILSVEEQSYQDMLNRGSTALLSELHHAEKQSSRTLAADRAHTLITGRGLPLDILRDECAHRNVRLDEEELGKLMAAERVKSRKARNASTPGMDDISAAIRDLKNASVKCTELALDTSSLSLMTDTRVVSVTSLSGESNERSYQESVVVIDPCPFYAMGGGQIGDKGTLLCPDGTSLRVVDTLRVSDSAVAVIVHGERAPAVGEYLKAIVNEKDRRLTAAHHTATHLLHAALKKTLGSHVLQAGSFVSPDRLRFDFSHNQPMSPEQIAAVEEVVQDAISASVDVQCTQSSYAAAQQRGAMALFGEKYGESVRVVSIGDRSLELCGGTHVANTRDLITFKIAGSSSVSAGIRRLEAVTSQTALSQLMQSHNTLVSLASSLKLAPKDVPDRIETMSKRIAELEEKLDAAQIASAFAVSGRGIYSSVPVVFYNVTLPDGNKGLLKTGALKLATQQPSVLHVFCDNATVAVACTQAPLQAKDVLDKLFKSVGGRGGGGASFAQGVATDATDLKSRVQAWSISSNQ